jgi:hypothetical protein
LDSDNKRALFCEFEEEFMCGYEQAGHSIKLFRKELAKEEIGKEAFYLASIPLT